MYAGKTVCTILSEVGSKRYEEEMGLSYFGRRYYDAALGRWLNPDPSGYKDGYNLYCFVLNDPLLRLDLYGLYAVPGMFPPVSDQRQAQLNETAYTAFEGFGEGYMHSLDTSYRYAGYMQDFGNALKNCDFSSYRQSWDSMSMQQKINFFSKRLGEIGGLAANACMLISMGRVATVWGLAKVENICVGKSLFSYLGNRMVGPRLQSTYVNAISKQVTKDLALQTKKNVGVNLSSDNSVKIKASSRLRPDLQAQGAHSVFKRDFKTGEIIRYETYRRQTNPYNPNPWESVKRFDGNPIVPHTHYNKILKQDIGLPHVHDSKYPGGVRYAEKWEKPISGED